MTDRELLELAAKAAGKTGVYQHWRDSRDIVSCGIAPNGSVGRLWWNPLTDDGEALQLAVFIVAYGFDFAFIQEAVMLAIKRREDPKQAARYAVVRAAAEIGKTMPSRAPLLEREHDAS